MTAHHVRRETVLLCIPSRELRRRGGVGGSMILPFRSFGLSHLGGACERYQRDGRVKGRGLLITSIEMSGCGSTPHFPLLLHEPIGSRFDFCWGRRKGSVSGQALSSLGLTSRHRCTRVNGSGATSGQRSPVKRHMTGKNKHVWGHNAVVF